MVRRLSRLPFSSTSQNSIALQITLLLWSHNTNGKSCTGCGSDHTLDVNIAAYRKRVVLNLTASVLRFVGSEVLTAVVMKSSMFWDITPCSQLKVNRRFTGTCHLHLQGRRKSRARYQRESRWQRSL
jgi:hypothetical protein